MQSRPGRAGSSLSESREKASKERKSLFHIRKSFYSMSIPKLKVVPLYPFESQIDFCFRYILACLHQNFNILYPHKGGIKAIGTRIVKLQCCRADKLQKINFPFKFLFGC